MRYFGYIEKAPNFCNKKYFLLFHYFTSPPPHLPSFIILPHPPSLIILPPSPAFPHYFTPLTHLPSLFYPPPLPHYFTPPPFPHYFTPPPPPSLSYPTPLPSLSYPPPLPHYFTDEVPKASERLILINNMADGEGRFDLEEFKDQFYIYFKVMFFLL